MKKIILIGASIVLIACGKKENHEIQNSPQPISQEPENVSTESETKVEESGTYDATLGEGKFSKLEIANKLDGKLASEGEKSANSKCVSCHKLTSEKLIGPGWKGITERRTSEWIMNFITNTDVMLDKDPELKKQMAECKVRMPNLNISEDEARNILEYMRKIDGIK